MATAEEMDRRHGFVRDLLKKELTRFDNELGKGN